MCGGFCFLGGVGGGGGYSGGVGVVVKDESMVIGQAGFGGVRYSVTKRGDKRGGGGDVDSLFLERNRRGRKGLMADVNLWMVE